MLKLLDLMNTQLPHAGMTNLIFWNGNRKVTPVQVVAEGIDKEINYFDHLATGTDITEAVREAHGWLKGGWTLRQLEDGVAKVRARTCDKEEWGHTFKRLLIELPHGGMIEMLADGAHLTPKQVIDQAVANERAHLARFRMEES